MVNKPNVALTIAGNDASGGAGIGVGTENFC